MLNLLNWRIIMIVELFLYIFLGLFVGVFSGIVGIGGGILLIPALTIIFKLSQHVAQGTVLAMLALPVGILAAWVYWKEGHVDLRIAALLAIGFFVGSFFGAKFAVGVNEKALSMGFGVLLIIIGIKMLFFPK